MSFFEKIKVAAEITENRLSEILAEKDKGIAEKLQNAISYSLLGGGKRLRSYMAQEFCGLCGGDWESALDYGCAIEMIHAFSLIHDDLPAMDDDDLRRGKPSNHKAFGEATAILAGDSLALDAFAVAGKNKKCRMEQNAKAMVLISEKAGALGMCGGQQCDIDGEGKELSLDELLLLVDLKTGALFSASCALGCIAADAGDEKTEMAKQFGLLCGRAFQITDDLLDIRSNESELGKTIGKDIAQQKSTFPSLLGEFEAEEYATNCIFQAKEILKAFQSGEARARLEEFCDYILSRKL
jgi:geranylgeranyl diphosphate synthase type II